MEGPTCEAGLFSACGMAANVKCDCCGLWLCSFHWGKQGSHPSKGHWVFEVPKTDMSRGGAWDRCVRSGKRVGIPQNAWSKNHTKKSWRYYTVDEFEVQRREDRYLKQDSGPS